MIGIQFGFNYGYFNQQTTQTSQQPGEQAPQGGATTSSSSTTVVQSVGMPVFAAPFVAAPVMMAPMAVSGFGYPAVAGGAQYSGGAAQAANEGRGHVTHNPTNAMQSAGGAAPQGFGGFNGFGGIGGGFAAAAVVPVFYQIGFPFIFAGGGVGQPGVPAVDPEPVPPVIDVEPAPGPTLPSLPADDAPVIVDETPVPVPADAVPPVFTPPAASGGNPFPIEGLDVDSFDRLRMREVERSLETTLSLDLTTRDGDKVTLDFRQLDVSSSTRVRGALVDGGRARHMDRSNSFDRFVNMDVQGELSDAEKAAIDEVLATVIDTANHFFGGDSIRTTMQKLTSMDFDLAELADFSLKMSVEKSVSVDRMYKRPDQPLQVLADQDAQIAQTLEFFASEQRNMIDMARTGFDDESAVRLVNNLLPPMLDGLLGELQQAVVEADAEGQDSADVEDDEQNDAAA